MHTPNFLLHLLIREPPGVGCLALPWVVGRGYPDSHHCLVRPLLSASIPHT